MTCLYCFFVILVMFVSKPLIDLIDLSILLFCYFGHVSFQTLDRFMESVTQASDQQY